LSLDFQNPANKICNMNLDDNQRQRVTAWILQGAKLSEIQSRLAEEFGLRLTYMEVRLLVDDLKLTPKDPEPPKNAEPPPAATKVATPPAEPPPSTGKVSVMVDQLTRPGAIVSGKVTFSDGQTAEWHLDQSGRLGVVPKQPGYKPSAADVQHFQMALEKEISRMGF
jgi:hypothetical protein